MNINPILNNRNFVNNKIQQSVNLSNHSSISFQGGYNDFKDKFVSIYGPNANLTSEMLKVTNTGKLIGQGSTKKVYQIPMMPEYVVAKMIDAQDGVTPPIHKASSIAGDKFNFGEPIATNDHNLLIMEIIKGKAHSVENWINSVSDFYLKDIQPSQEKSKEFLASMKDMSEMPQDAFDYAASEIKYLSDKGIKLDVINPNNIMVDKEKGELHCIDLYDKQEKFDKNLRKNTMQDMIAVFCDSTMHTVFYNQLDDSDKKNLNKYTKKIINKCVIASNKTNLEDDFDTTLKGMKICNEQPEKKDFHPKHKFDEQFMKFAKMYDIAPRYNTL